MKSKLKYLTPAFLTILTFSLLTALGCTTTGLAPEKVEILENSLAQANEHLAAYDAQIASLQATLDALVEAGAMPEAVEPVADTLREATQFKEAVIATIADFQEQLTAAKDGDGGVDYMTLIFSVIASLVGSPVVNRYLPNSFLLRGKPA